MSRLRLYGLVTPEQITAMTGAELAAYAAATLDQTSSVEFSDTPVRHALMILRLAQRVAALEALEAAPVASEGDADA